MKEATSPDLKLNQQLCFPLYAASNLMTRLYRPLLRELGLTYPQYLVMLALWEQAPAGVGELGERLYLDSGTLTPLLKRLEAAGLVERARSSQDERRVQVSLTAKGRSLKTKARPLPGALACRIDLPSDELLRLRGGLQQLVQVLARCPDVSGLWRGRQVDRLHRSAGGDRQDPRPPGGAGSRVQGVVPREPGSAGR